MTLTNRDNRDCIQKTLLAVSALLSFCFSTFGCFDLEKAEIPPVQPQFSGEMEWVSQVRGFGIEDISHIVRIGSTGGFLVTGGIIGDVGAFVGFDSPDDGPSVYVEQVGGENFFAVRYERQGPSWAATQSSGTSSRINGALELEIDNSVITAGHYAGLLTVPDVGLLDPLGWMGTFLIKFNAQGEIIWARHASTHGEINGLTAPPEQGSVYFYTCGYFADGTLFSTGSKDQEHIQEYLDNSMCYGMFVAKYHKDGTLVHLETGSGCASCKGLASPGNSSIVAVGVFSDSLELTSPGSADLSLRVDSSLSSNDVFLSSYSTRDAKQIAPNWIRRIGGGEDDDVVGVASKGNGSFVVAGNSTGGYINFEGGNNEDIRLEQTGNSQFTTAFVARYNEEGDLLWAKMIRGSGDVTARAIDVSENGDVLVVGDFNRELIFDSSPKESWSIFSRGTRDIFITLFDKNGKIKWARREGGLWDWERASGAAFLDHKSAIVSGMFMGDITFAEGEPQARTLKSVGHTDGFLMRLLLEPGAATNRSE